MRAKYQQGIAGSFRSFALSHLHTCERLGCKILIAMRNVTGTGTLRRIGNKTFDVWSTDCRIERETAARKLTKERFGFLTII